MTALLLKTVHISSIKRLLLEKRTYEVKRKKRKKRKEKKRKESTAQLDQIEGEKESYSTDCTILKAWFQFWKIKNKELDEAAHKA